MNMRKSWLPMAAAAALLAPTLTLADSPWVPANNQRGYNYQPERDAMPAGARGRSFDAVSAPGPAVQPLESAPLDTASGTATGKTRQQVREEFLNLSPAERQQLRALNRD